MLVQKTQNQIRDSELNDLLSYSFAETNCPLRELARHVRMLNNSLSKEQVISCEFILKGCVPIGKLLCLIRGVLIPQALLVD